MGGGGGGCLFLGGGERAYFRVEGGNFGILWHPAVASIISSSFYK